MVANATRHSHSSPDVYKPSYVGRLIHADIVGPFKVSATGGYRYALVLVDDHSRFKFVYFLKTKDDALKRVRTFIGELKATLNKGRPEPAHVLGSLRSDNAGEFLSREFKDLLDSELVSQTTCPPHVHSLNGVAERAIRSIVENARSHMQASSSPLGFWPQAFEHAVDILNRTSTPPDGDHSSYELMHGTKPKILPVQPFGCRTVAVLPRHKYSKQSIEAHGVSGINLGFAPSVAHGYRVWVPSLGKIMISSDVYFDATFMPWRPEGDRRVGPVHPVAPPEDSRPAAPGAGEAPPEAPTAASISDAYDLAVRGDHAVAKQSTKALILFSGPYARPDGIHSYLAMRGISADLVDSDPQHGGGQSHDLLNDVFYRSLLDRVSRGDYFAIFAAPPCSTFSVARHFPKGKSSPRPVRNRRHVHGLPDLPIGHRRELNSANRIIARTVALLAAGRRCGAEFVIENPCDRGNSNLTASFLHKDHCPLWLLPEVKALAHLAEADYCTFPQCAFGAKWQKRTTLMYTPGFHEFLSPLKKLFCNHSFHGGRLDGQQGDDGTWETSEAAAYPPQLNYFFARSIEALKVAPNMAKPPKHVAARRPETSVEPNDEPAIPEAPDTTPTEPSPIAPRQLPSPVKAPSFDLVDDEPVAAAPIAPNRADAPEPIVSLKHLGTRAERGSPIRKSLRPRKALYLGGGVLNLSPWHGRANLASAAPPARDPRTRKEALFLDSEGWTVSMQKEMDNHEKNGSWEWVPISDMEKGRRLIKLIWVFKTKRDGSLKSRLCVQGCTQVAGVDYDQTFSAALRSPSLRLLAAYAAQHGAGLNRWDFVSAYLQGELEEGEVVYCHPPPGYERPGYVCKVVKPVYGMAQAGRRWQRSLFPWLVNHGFVQSENDPCIFRKDATVQTPSGPRDETLLVGVYVDDLCVVNTYTDKYSLYQSFVTALKEWNVEDEGALTDLLGIDFDFSDNCVTLRQSKYIQKLVHTYLPDGVPNRVQKSSRPCNESLPQLVADALCDSEPSDPELLKRYQSLVGALLYCATNTRPDIAYAVGMLCRAMGKPTPDLLLAAERVLSYLHHHSHLGLRFERSDEPLYGMTDSDWAVKHSTSGYVFVLNQATVSWGSKKQTSVALSSCEAEIVAGSEAAKEAIHLTGLARELGLHDDSPINVHMDNRSGIDVAYNPEHHTRMKHVERRHFFIRECVEQHRIRVPFVRSEDNLADFFTKPLPSRSFWQMRDRIMNVPQARGGVVDSPGP